MNSNTNTPMQQQQQQQHYHQPPLQSTPIPTPPSTSSLLKHEYRSSSPTSAAQDSSSSGGRSAKRLRSIAACNRCKTRKQRCDNAFPKCTNCRKAGAECVSKEQTYPASYVHSLEDYVHKLEGELKEARAAGGGSVSASGSASSSGLPSVAAEASNTLPILQGLSGNKPAQSSPSTLTSASSAAPATNTTPAMGPAISQPGMQQHQQQQQQQQLPPINFVKTSSSGGDQPASRELIGMTMSNPPNYYLGSASGFPLTKLVQAAIFGNALPKTIPMQTNLPQLPPLSQSFPPNGYAPAPIETPTLPLPPIIAPEEQTQAQAQAQAQALPHPPPPSQRPPHQSPQIPQQPQPPQLNLSSRLQYPPSSVGPAPTESQLAQNFLLTIPPPHMADRLVTAYLNGVHHRYPFIYRGDILDWNTRRDEIARALARIAVKKSAMAMGAGTGLGMPSASANDRRPSRDESGETAAVAGQETKAGGSETKSNAQLQIEYDEKEIQSIWFKLHMVYAIGAGYLQLTGTYTYIPPETHYYIAMRYLDLLSDSPLIEVIEKLLLVVVFQLRSPSGPGIWHLTGFTMRLCVEAGFHRKLSSTTSALDDQRRKKIFWCLYVLERSVSVTLGRPFCIADRDIDVELPANVDESIRDPVELEEAIARSKLTDVTSMTSSIFIMQIKRIASHIQEKIYRVDKLELPYDQKFRDLRRELDDWGKQIHECEMIKPLSSTPTPRLYMSEEYYMLNYYGNMRLLFVPKLPALPSDSEEFKLCLRSAGHICQVYKRLHQYLRTVSYSFIALQATYMAGITMIYCYTKDPSILDTQLLADIRACSTVLYIIAERWPASKHFRDSFETFLNSAIESGVFLTHDSKLSEVRSGALSSMAEGAEEEATDVATAAAARNESAGSTSLGDSASFPAVSSGFSASLVETASGASSTVATATATATATETATTTATTTSSSTTTAPLQFDMNLSSIIQVPRAPSMPSELPISGASSSGTATAAPVEGDGGERKGAAEVLVPAQEVTSSSSGRNNSSSNNTRGDKSVLVPVQGELWDILQQGAQQQAGAVADPVAQEGSSYTAQFDPLSLGLPINGLSGLGIGGLGMAAFNGGQSKAAAGAGAVGGQQFLQQQPLQHTQGEPKQMGYLSQPQFQQPMYQQQQYQFLKPHHHQQAQPLQQQQLQHQQQQQQQQGFQGQVAVGTVPGAWGAQGSAGTSSLMMSPNGSTNAMLSAMGMWPMLGNTVASGGVGDMAPSSAESSSNAGRRQSTGAGAGETAPATAASEASSTRARAGSAAGRGGAHLQEMNAEMGMGLGNAALFRWAAGDIGDLYY